MTRKPAVRARCARVGESTPQLPDELLSERFKEALRRTLAVSYAKPSWPRAELIIVGNAIMVSPRLSPQSRRAAVARALAHWLIKRRGFGARDEHVAIVAGALLAGSKNEAHSRACMLA